MIFHDNHGARSLRVLGALCVAAVVAILYTTIFSEDRSSMLFMGDLPGFYALGRIVLEGHGDRLYDFNYQQEIQNRFWPILDNSFLPTMYPPFAAVYMAAFAWIPPIPLRCALALFDIGLLWFALRALCPTNRVPRFSLVLFSLPLFISIAAAQNTIVSIALLTLTRYLLQTRRAFLSGVCAGLLFYKPQIGLLCSVVMLIGATPSFIVGTALSVLVQYLLGYWVYKGEWLIPWIQKMRTFSSLRASLDGFQMTSLVNHLSLQEWLYLSQQSCELLICASCVLALLVYSRMRKKSAHEPGGSMDLFIGTFPVFTPQTMFYDLGISIFWVFAGAGLSSKRSLYAAIGLVIAVNACVASRATASFLTPLAASLVAFYALRVFACRDS